MNYAYQAYFNLRLAEVPAVVGLSEATIQRLVRENQFPKPRMLSGRRVAWLLREVEEWAESRPVSDLPPPPNTSHRRPVIDWSDVQPVVARIKNSSQCSSLPASSFLPHASDVGMQCRSMYPALSRRRCSALVTSYGV